MPASRASCLIFGSLSKTGSEAATLHGVVADLIPLAAEVCEVCVEVPRSPEYIPGQYYSVQFRGFPARYFSPTAPLDWPYDEALMRFHITRVPNGRVSSMLGKRIRAGHRVSSRVRSVRPI